MCPRRWPGNASGSSGDIRVMVSERPFDDVPDAAVSALLQAAAAPVSPGQPLPGEDAARRAFRERHTAPASLRGGRFRHRVGVAVASVSFTLAGATVAAAATGSLPDPAQRLAHAWLDQLGVGVPAPSAVGEQGATPQDGGAPLPGPAPLPSPPAPADVDDRRRAPDAVPMTEPARREEPRSAGQWENDYPPSSTPSPSYETPPQQPAQQSGATVDRSGAPASPGTGDTASKQAAPTGPAGAGKTAPSAGGDDASSPAPAVPTDSPPAVSPPDESRWTTDHPVNHPLSRNN
jgi:hypothetical protein